MAAPEDLEAEGVAPPAAPAAQAPSLESATSTTLNSDDNGRDRSLEGETRKQRSKTLEPTTRFSARQIFYLVVLHGFVALAVSGGINFAIAYGMYSKQNPVTRPIRLWQLPNTLAGDAAVTIFVQCVATWFVELILLHIDLRFHSVQPIGFIPQPSNRWLRLFFLLPRDPSAGVGDTRRKWNLLELIQQVLRGLSFGVVSFLILWPIFMGSLTGFGRREGAEYVYHDKWLPQVFKLILGGVLGLLTTPLMAMFWLVKAGWEYQKDEETTPVTAEV